MSTQLGLNWFQLPVEDDRAPEWVFEKALTEHKAELLQQLEDKKVIAIHCRGGSGRTGLMAAILMLESGISWQVTEQSIKAIRPKSLTLSSHRHYLTLNYNI